MKTYDITLSLVTPCISRGGLPETAEFRAPSIRGALRFWFRTLGGNKQREKELFGGIGAKQGEERKSQIIVRIKKEPAQKEYDTPAGIAGGKFDYFLGLWKSNEEKAYFPADQEAEIQIIDKSDSSDFEVALKAFLYLGTLGSRSRRTYGSIYPKTVSCNGIPWENIPQTLEDFQNYLKSSGLVNATILSLSSGDRRFAVDSAKNFLKAFRCGSTKSGIPSVWGKAEHDLIKQIPNSAKMYRAALGLPLMQRYSEAKRTYRFSLTQGERWASPLLLKVIPIDGKFTSLAIFLKDYFIKENTDVYRDGRKFPLSHELINAMMDPNQTKVSGVKSTLLYTS